MIYGKLVRYLPEIQIKSRIISYWSRIPTGKYTKIEKLICDLAICMNHEIGKGGGGSPWHENIKHIFVVTAVYLILISKY